MATIGALIYKLGLDVSELTENVNKVGTKLDGLDSFAKKAGSALAGMVSIGAVTAAVSKYTEFTGRIADNSAAVGLSASAYQKLDYALSQNGSSMEAGSKAINKMSQGLVAGDQSTVGALKTLGLSLDDLRKQAPDQAFMAMTDAVKQIENPMQQAALGTKLFGKAWLDIAPAVKAGISETANEAERLGLVMSDEAVAAGDNFGDSMDRLQLVGMSLLSSVLEPIIPVLTTVADAFAQYVLPAVNGVKLGFSYLISFGMQAIGRLYEMAAAGADLAVKYGGPVAKALGINGDVAQGLRGSAQWYKDAAAAQMQLTAASTVTAPAVQKMVPPIRDTGTASHAAADALKALTDRVTAAGEAGAKFAPKFQIVGGMLVQVAPQARETGINMEFTGFAISGVTSTLPAFVSGLQPVVAGISTLGLRAKSVGQTLKDDLMGALRDLPSVLSQAFTGGGGLLGGLQAIGTSVSSSLGKALFSSNAVGGSIVSGITSLFSSANISSALSAALPGIGSAIGAIAGPLLGKLGSWLGGNSEGRKLDQDATKQIQDIQASLVQTYGSLQQIDAVGRSIGVDLAGAWGDKSRAGLEHFKGLVEQFNARLGEQKALQEQIAAVEDQIGQLRAGQVPTWQQMESLISQYGIDVAGLGNQVQQLKINDMATQFLNAFETLTAGGADANGVLAGMSDEISDLVQQSMSYGVAIPENMRPIIESLMAQGQLFGANKVKITDISGLKWGAPVESEADKINSTLLTLNETLKTLTERLAGLPAVASTVASGLEASLGTPPWEGWSAPDFPTWEPGGSVSLPGHAAGGVFSQPHAAWIAEGGQSEIVGSVGFMRTALRGAMADLGSPSTGPSSRDDAGLRDEMGAIRRLLRDFPRAVGVAVADAQALRRTA